MRNAVAKFALTVLVVLGAGCTPAAKQTTSDFAGPSGMVLAGSKFNYVFVANSGVDAVQVINVTPALKDVDLVPGPVRYFPRYIPAGPNPTELAATVDGRFVLILDLVTGSLRLIDADKLALVRDSTGQPVDMPLGPSNAQPGAMVGASVACLDNGTGTCLGRFYITLRGLGHVAVVDVRQAAGDGQTPTLSVTDWIPVGGEPLRLATVPGQDVFFVTDAARSSVLRVDRRAANVRIDPFNIGSPGGPIAVSGDGTLVVVGRPAARDVVLLSNGTRDGLEGALSLVDADPLYTPAPQCIQPCGQSTCANAHPADAALCASNTGVDGDAQSSYGGLYLGFIPGQMAAVKATASAPVQGACSTGTTPTPAFTHGVSVATLDGSLFFVALRDATGALVPQLVPTDSCGTPSLTSPQGQVAPSAFLQPCPPTPQRRRFNCLTDSSGTSSGVVALARGQLAAPVTWTFAWEAVLPNLDRSQGSGTVLSTGQFTDAGLTSGLYDIRAGDTLQLTSAVPQSSATCAQFSAGGCTEVTIDSVDTSGAALVLTTSPKIPPECYVNTPVITYRVRAGHQFVVTGTDDTGAPYGAPTRLGLDKLYGLGTQNGPSSVLLRTQQLQEAPADTPRCQLYNTDGSLKAGTVQNPLLNRHDFYTMTVTDPYVPARKGLQYDVTNAVSGTLGKVPGGMVVTQGASPLLFVSFAGSDLVVVSNPLNATAVLNDDTNNMILQ